MATERERRQIGDDLWEGLPEHLDFLEHLHEIGELPTTIGILQQIGEQLSEAGANIARAVEEAARKSQSDFTEVPDE